METHPAPSDPVRVHRIHAAVVGALRSGDRAAAVDALDHHFAVIPPGIPEVAPLRPEKTGPSSKRSRQ